MKAITALVVVVVACAGCSTLKQEPIQISDGVKTKTVGSVTTWSPDKAAAVVVNQKVCMQLPTRIVSLGGGGLGAASGDASGVKSVAGGANVKAAAAAAGDWKSTASSAITSTERTTFLSFGLFYLCQMAMNGSIKEQRIEEMMQFLVTESVKIGAETKPPAKPAEPH
ncbi:TPA: hypothetical protein UOA92_001113 [Stenotrophomonas maltophilia]|nr:hypothetical protein [Stenotrophomonas maltophilia]